MSERLLNELEPHPVDRPWKPRGKKRGGKKKVKLRLRQADPTEMRAMPGGNDPPYDPKFAEEARKVCELGATERELARALGVTTQAIRDWRLKHQDFREAVTLGEAYADARVEQALFDRAVGYEYEVEQLFYDRAKGEIVRQHVTVQVPPDTQAGIFWLKNRQPHRWRDAKQLDIGPEIDLTALSEDEVDQLFELTRKLDTQGTRKVIEHAAQEEGAEESDQPHRDVLAPTGTGK